VFRLRLRRIWAKAHNVLDSPLGRETTIVAAHAAAVSPQHAVSSKAVMPVPSVSCLLAEETSTISHVPGSVGDRQAPALRVASSFSR
jgi:hypothetical protein